MTVEQEFRLRWVVHLRHIAMRRPNAWPDRPFCFICAMRRFAAWRSEQ